MTKQKKDEQPNNHPEIFLEVLAPVNTVILRPKVFTQYNYEQQERHQRVCETASCTAPNKTMGIKEILARHKAGTLDGMNVYSQPGKPIYDEDNPFPGLNFHTLDLAELQQLKEEAQQNVREMQAKMTDYQKAQVAKQKEQLEALQARIKELEAQQPPAKE